MTSCCRHKKRLASSATAMLLVVILAAACRPELGDRDSHVTGATVLAVRGEPAEAKPGDAVVFTLLVATPTGPIDAPIASWAYCATPKLLTENGIASAQCLASGVRAVAEGPSSISTPIPEDACALFGPEITSADLRPRDPDVTGGFYQPLRVTVFGQERATLVAFGLERVSCKLANAPADITTDFAKRYVANKNPELLPLMAMSSSDGTAVPFDSIPHSARITLRASWPDTSAEHYVVFDPASRTVVDHREAMRVSWFVSDGVVDNDRTGRAEEELATFTDNGWSAPADARTTHLFVVLRDARGGVAFTSQELITR
jgi:hypothetical protein